MNKRVLCLLLSLLMLMTVVFTSCSQKSDEGAEEDIAKEASESTVTLTMYLMSEKEVTDEQASEIQTAVNRITKSKFKTQIVLRYFTEAEYNEALDKAFKDTEDAREAKKAAEQSLKEAIKKGEATAAKTTTAVSTEEETIVNEYGVTELKYPTVTDYQVDIFYLGGYDRFNEYLEKKLLSKLDEELTSSSKLLKDYLSPDYLTYTKSVANGTYAIPNNTVIGEYTYLLLHKEVLKEYHYSVEETDFTGLACDAVSDILANVSKHNKEYRPLWSGTGELDVVNINYFGMDENGNLSHDFSVIGGQYDPSFSYKGKNQYYGYSGGVFNGNIFTDVSFQNQVSKLISYKENGYYGTEADANKPFAVGYVKGGAELEEIYAKDYEMVAVASPKMTTESLFSNMFAVGAYTSSVSRSMEIITYLNTNADFRNLILYGIEGINYEVVENELDGKTYKCARRLTESYMMDPAKTGNVFISYPLDGELVNIRDYQIQQNRDMSAMLDLGFSLAYGDEDINVDAMNKIRELSKTLYDEMMACKTVEEWETFLNGFDSDDDTKDVVGVKDLVNNDVYAKLMRDNSYSSKSETYNEETNGKGCSFAFIYFSWLKNSGIYVEEA